MDNPHKIWKDIPRTGKLLFVGLVGTSVAATFLIWIFADWSNSIKKVQELRDKAPISIDVKER